MYGCKNALYAFVIENVIESLPHFKARKIAIWDMQVQFIMVLGNGMQLVADMKSNSSLGF